MRSFCKPLLSLALVGVVFAGPAFAQQAGNEYPAACEDSNVTKSDHERAHTVFLSGKQFLEESNYEKAISYFKDAYSIDCSVHAILPIIATAYERKGDKAEAIRALGEYLGRAPNAPDHVVIEHRIRNLKDQLAREQPAPSPPPTTTSPASPAPPPSTATIPPAAVPPAPAAPPLVSPEGGPEGSQSPMPWVFVGVGGAGVVAGVILMIVGAGEISSAETGCGVTHHNCATKDDVNKGNNGRTHEIAGEVVGAVGLAAVAGGLIWHFVQAPGGAKVTASPSVAPGYAGVGIAGVF
jgi:tetratricopeptide (TPR) repeat protein